MISTTLLNPLISQMGNLGGTGPVGGSPTTGDRAAHAQTRVFLFKLVQIAASRLDPNDGNLGQEQGLWGEADSNPGLF